MGKKDKAAAEDGVGEVQVYLGNFVPLACGFAPSILLLPFAFDIIACGYLRGKMQMQVIRLYTCVL